MPKPKIVCDVRQVAQAVYQSDQVNTNLEFDVIHHVVDIAMRKLWLAGMNTGVEINITEGLKLKVEVVE